MKKLLFAAITICCLLLMFACVNEDISSTSQPEMSENASVPENSTASEDKDISEGAPEASVPEESKPETSTTEESLPEVFKTKPAIPETVTVPAGYADILALIEEGIYEQAYELLLQKEYDIYAEKLLERFCTYYKEYNNNYLWYESGVMWEVRSYSVDENGRPLQKRYHMSFSPTVTNPNIQEYVYNEDGLLTEHDGREYGYDEKGRLTQTISYNSDGKAIAVIKLYWYENGLLAKEETYRSPEKDGGPDSITEYFYDSNGRIIRENVYQNGVFNRVVQFNHTNDGKKEKETVIYRNGETEVTNYYYHGITKKIIKIETISTDGYVVNETFEYDNGGNLLLHSKMGNDYRVFFRYQYVYDKNGHIELMTWANREHLALDYGTTLYTTDANGNVIKEENRGYNDHSGLKHVITTSGYDAQGNLKWSNTEHPENEKVWSKTTYGGYTVFYDEFMEYRFGQIVH